MKPGVFTISLDFELFWGVRDHRTLEQYGRNIETVHRLVPPLLELFRKYEVHCTWATVGFLFHHNREELMQALPALLPDYTRKEYDPYPYVMENGLDPRFHFAPDLIKAIEQVPGQEIATHTYSHFYTLEKNTDPAQFRADLALAIRVAEEKGYSISSIVFPRNQYGEDHIGICRELGIQVYRGNEESGAYRPVSREDEKLSRRAIRLADAYINLTGHHVHPWPEKEAIVNIPASRFLRPYHHRLRWLDSLKKKRICRSLEEAARTGGIYQLWWHPHNFGDHTAENFSFLEQILIKFAELKQRYQMVSLTLKEIYDSTRAN